MKKIYITMIIIIMLSSLLSACMNDTEIQPETSLPQIPEPTLAPTEWPEVYSAILKDYRTLADHIYHDDDYSFFDLWDTGDFDEWETQNIPDLNSQLVGSLMIKGLYYRERDDFGYALKDLNGDGVDELIFLSKDYMIFAVYSTEEGKPMLLYSYWDRHRCYAIDESGLLYIHGSDGAEDWVSGAYRVSNNGSKLQPVAEYGMSRDGLTLEDDGYYYKVIDEKRDGEREIVSKAEFDEFYSKYPVFADWESGDEITKSVLVFIPILD